MAENTQSTPPHLPTYDVHLSYAQIRTIVSLVLPEIMLFTSQQLESGKSFNNRIYFIQSRSKSSSSSFIRRSSWTDINHFVLKLSGHYFGPRKVQNEIGSLLLLAKHCPSIPIPRVVAWSEDGSVIRTLDGRMIATQKSYQQTILADQVIPNAFSKHGWILTTRLPGQVLNQSYLEGPHRDSLLKEMAEHIVSWRTSIPQTVSMGNLRFVEASEMPAPTSVFNLFERTVSSTDNASPLFTPGGLILCHRYSPDPLSTVQSYYSYQVTDQLFHLRRSPTLKALRHKIETKVQQLVNDLPRFSFLSSNPDPNTINFTHLDFSPRNILISTPKPGSSEEESQPHVSGILDFEFSAFLPSDEEFVNMAIRQSDDWTPEQYSAIVTEVARRGCPVPHLPGQYGEPVCTKATRGTCTCDSGAFEGVCILAKVIESIAPWFIQDGSHSVEELEQQTDIAAEAVLSGIEKLQRFLT